MPEAAATTQPPLAVTRAPTHPRDHMRAVAEGIARVYERREEIKGLKFVYEPKMLRFFQGRFEGLD